MYRCVIVHVCAAVVLSSGDEDEGEDEDDARLNPDGQVSVNITIQKLYALVCSEISVANERKQTFR